MIGIRVRVMRGPHRIVGSFEFFMAVSGILRVTNIFRIRLR